MATRVPSGSSSVRKSPRQARSLATTEAILDATTHILGERGWSGLTTNAVAEVAGVSIGSVYQYFPNKTALTEAVRRRHFDTVIAVLRSAVDKKLSASQRIAALVDGMIDVHSRYPSAWRVLLEECPPVPDAEETHRRFEIEWRKGYEAIIRMNQPRARSNVSIRAGVLGGALAGAVHDAARRGILGSPMVRQEILCLVRAYLSHEFTAPEGRD